MVYRKFTLFSFQCIKDYCIVAYRVIFFFTLTKQYYNYLIDDLFYNSDEWCWYFVSASENGQTLVKMWLLILTFVYFNLPYHFFFSINFKVTGTSNVICSSSFHFSIKADRKKNIFFSFLRKFLQVNIIWPPILIWLLITNLMARSLRSTLKKSEIFFD